MPRFHDALRRIEEPQVVAGVIMLTAIGFTVPFAIEQNSWAEWGTAYWAIQQQTDSIVETGFPTRFVSTPESGAFYPWFVFYAGGIFSVLGYIAQVVGSWVAFLLSITLAFAASTYGALLALRALRCPPEIRLLLALAAGFSPYMVTLLYGRGAWAELLGVSSAWLLVGAGLALLQAQSDIQRARRLLLVALSTLVLAVSHNLSLAVGIPFAVTLWVALAFSGRVVIQGQGRNVSLLTGALLSGLLISGGWLFPNLAYGSKTQISSWDWLFGTLASFDQLSVVFSPLLHFPEEQTRLNLLTFGEPIPIRVFNQTLSLLLIPVSWVVAQILIEPLRSLRKKYPSNIWTKRQGSWRVWGRLSLLIGLLVFFTFLMTNESIWKVLPSAVLVIQFPFRLNPYLTLVIMLCAGAATVLAIDRRQVGSSALVPALAVLALFYLGLASYQALTAQRVGPPGLGSATRAQIDATGKPPVWANSAASFQFWIVPEKSLQRPDTHLRISGLPQRAPNEVSDRVASRVVCSPFVSFSSSVRVVGTDDYGKCVLEVEEAGEPLEASGAWPFASKLGLIASAAGLALLALLMVWVRRSRAGFS